ncbi:hypothetical protein ACHAQH_008703 [Verticillium albo-atrum]
MNRFRTKKKTKEEAPPRVSNDSDSPAPFRLFGKIKKAPEEEPKKEIDLATALPSSDDFRTSLLMTGLSARFSMLKEQDDPTSKIGKASDDSVLFPKRQSRMLDFGFGPGLGDIAEVESIRGKAPFARMDSFHSSEGSTSGSMMDRAKPVDGNNLFGGRQKIYKLPNGGSSSKNLDGGMSGRALYGDDVTMSSFQRWRQNEREKHPSEDEVQDQVNLNNIEIPRAESPPPADFSRKRETNSSMSSAPSVGRNSTAATSITSQPNAMSKDWQPAGVSSHTTAATPALERSVTRTRRLYETGLMNDLHEQQNSALSRMDTLSRQRNLGSRTPDMLNAPSPTMGLFTDRFGDRKLLAKASAPNLRSMSPPMTASSMGTMDFASRVPNIPESKHSFNSNVVAPLSPPISESDDRTPLNIQPNDLGKATSMGVFSKPAQQYDESKYAQKQLQLQQGRETPTNRFRTGSSASQTNGSRSRSRSSSSAQRTPFEKMEPASQTEPTVQEDAAFNGTFLDTEDDQAVRPRPSQSSASSRGTLQRPSDQDHPALRESALPTPLSFASISGGPSPISERPSLSASHSHQSSPDDSPTLGPTTGLSGIVRQHLRSDSDTSSVYGGPVSSSFNAPKSLYGQYDPNGLSDLSISSNPWDSQSPDWQSSYFDSSQSKIDSKINTIEERPKQEQKEEALTMVPKVTPRSGTKNEAEKEDDFARHLADGARRVRERLTSYVESDSRSVSPQPAEREPLPSRPNPLHLLISKSSRGSLVDRSREREQAPPLPKVNKMLGLGASTMSSSPSPSKRSFDFEIKDPLSPMEEEPDRSSPSKQVPVTDTATSSPQATKEEQEVEEEKEEGMHAGLRAFRQARRELQKLKETETQQRHQPSAGPAPMPPSAPPPRPAQSRERPQGQRSPSRERRPPPVTYQPRPSQESTYGAGTPQSSRPSSRTERDRSGSENSNGSRSQSRPARLRNTSAPHEGLAPNGNGGSPRAMLRSPGLPGTDIRHSPIMPPRGHPPSAPPSGPLPGPPPGHFDRSVSGNLRVQPQHRGGYDSGQPSPISPMAPMSSPLMNSSAQMPHAQLPRRPSAPPTPNLEGSAAAFHKLDESAKRAVRKRDISEPTFVSSTSRVPTVNLPGETRSRSGSRSGTRSRSGSLIATASTPNLHALANGAVHAPPLPPINPKRRNMLGFRGGRKAEEELAGDNPHLPLAAHHGIPHQNDGNSAFSISDEDESGGRDRRRLRKATSEANGMNMRARQAQFNAPPMPNRPPMPGGMI